MEVKRNEKEPNNNPSNENTRKRQVEPEKDANMGISYIGAIWTGIIIFTLIYLIVALYIPSTPELTTVKLVIETLCPAFIAPGVLALLDFYLRSNYRKRERNQQFIELENNFREHLTTKIDDAENKLRTGVNLLDVSLKKLFHLEEIGIENALITLNQRDIEELVLKATTRVYIFTTWIIEETLLRNIFGLVLSKNIPVHLLLIDSESEAAKLRANDNDANLNSSNLKHIPRNALKRFFEINKKAPLVYLKYYDSLPYHQMYIIDNKIVVGSFWHSSRSNRRTHLIVDASSEYGIQLFEDFQEVWLNANPYIDSVNHFEDPRTEICK